MTERLHKGDRVRYHHTGSRFAKPLDEGTVIDVNHVGNAKVKWDNGHTSEGHHQRRYLELIPGPDPIEEMFS